MQGAVSDVFDVFLLEAIIGGENCAILYYSGIERQKPAQDEIRCKNFDVCGEEPPCVSGMVSGLCTKRCGMRGFGVLMLGGLILLTACSAPAVAGAAPASRQIIAMDTLMQFTIYGQEAEATVTMSAFFPIFFRVSADASNAPLPVIILPGTKNSLAMNPSLL